MEEQEHLELAIYIATLSHRKQFDKGGKPYILHPLHLMNQLMFDTELAIIAVLHDVVEDSNTTISNLKANGFSQRVISAVDLLTHKKNQSYDEYIGGICTNYDAVRVKRRDIEHNSDMTRLKGVGRKDLDRMEKYHRAFLKLGMSRTYFS